MLTTGPARITLSIVSSPDEKGKLKRPQKKEQRRKRFSFIRFFILSFLSAAPSAPASGTGVTSEFEKDLPDRWSALTDYKPSRASRVFSSEGELIGEFYLQKRIVLPYDQIPKHVMQAFVAAEDNRFFEHHGIDPLGIIRAAFANFKAGRVVQGGSTITQQVAKLMLVGNERNVFRKIREAILAHKIETRLKKEQILAIYANHVYLGHGAYGVQAAAEVYFGKDAKDLTVAEAAMLGGLPKAPTEDSPTANFKRAKDRQRYVLGQMLDNKFITDAQYRDALHESIAIISKDVPLNHIAAPYFVEHIRKLVQAKYAGRDLYDRGLQDLHDARHGAAARRRGGGARRARRGRSPLRLPRAGRRTSTTTSCAKFLEAMPTPYTGPKQDPTLAEQAAGVIVPNKIYLASFERQGKKAYARVGALRVRHRRVRRRAHRALDREARQQARRRRSHPGARGQGRGQARLGEEGVRRDRRSRRSWRSGRRCRRRWSRVDPANGHLTAMVGGYDYDLSQFNRATQARRQAGSSIKPYIYSAALENGFTEMSIVPDAPVSIKTAAGWWSPHNYKPQLPRAGHAAHGAAALAQHRQRAARRGDGRRQGDRADPQVRHHGADRAPSVDRARHARGDADGARVRLRDLPGDGHGGEAGPDHQDRRRRRQRRRAVQARAAAAAASRPTPRTSWSTCSRTSSKKAPGRRPRSSAGRRAARRARRTTSRTTGSWRSRATSSAASGSGATTSRASATTRRAGRRRRRSGRSS